MTQIEAGKLKNKILGPDLSKVIASLLSRYDLMHDTIKGICEVLHKFDISHFKKEADDYYHLFKDEKNIKKKSLNKMLLWANMVVEALDIVDHDSKIDNYGAEMILMGQWPYLDWVTLSSNVDELYCDLTERFLDEFDVNLKEYQNKLVKIENSNDSFFIKDHKKVALLIEIVRDVFVKCENSIE